MPAETTARTARENLIRGSGEGNTRGLMNDRLRVVRTVNAVLIMSFVLIAQPDVAGAQCGQHQLVVDGRSVCTDASRNTLDLLRQHVSSSRLPLNGDYADQSPLVLLDGIVVYGGPARLVDVPVGHVQSVTVLRPADAVLRYGSKAARGAILIVTGSGRRRHG